jgi:hypothetical protein
MVEMIISSNLNGGRYFASTLSSAADPDLRGEPSDVEHPSTPAQQQFELVQKPNALLQPKMLLSQPQRVGDEWRAAADASHTAALRETAGRQLHPRGCLLSTAPLNILLAKPPDASVEPPPRHHSIFGGSVKLDHIPFFANLVLAFLHVLRRNRTGEAKSTGPNSGFEIFVRGVRTYSLDES